MHFHEGRIPRSRWIDARQEAGVIAAWRKWLRPSARSLLDELATLQADFLAQLQLRDAVPAGDPTAAYIQTLDKMWRLCGATLTGPPQGILRSSAVLISPHLGMSKLMKDVFRRTVGATVADAIPNGEPPLWRQVATYAAYSYLVGSQSRLVPVEAPFLPPADALQLQYGALIVDATVGGFVALLELARARTLGDSCLGISVLPEGSTTGKRTFPPHAVFEVGAFRRGFVGLASRLDLPIVCVAHGVDSFARSHVRIAEPVHPPFSAHTLFRCQEELRRSMDQLLMPLMGAGE